MENLIAGAWGCGVFMQDPSTVATLLVNAARNYNIPNIYFAIPNRNFRIFLEVLEKLIIARRDLNILVRQVFWKSYIGEVDGLIGISLDRDLFHNWIAEAETKVVCRAKNKNDLLKAVKIAEELGL